MYDLEPSFDSRKSFYDKAKVVSSWNKTKEFLILYSYDTKVAEIEININKRTKTYKYLGKFSQTTTRHQKEFFKQNNLNDKEIKELFEKGEKVVEY